MSGIYSTKTPELSTLGDVDINLSTIANNDVLQYNSTNNVWENGPLDLSGTDINVDEIDCRVLRVSETADIVGRLANQGVASFVNDEFIFQNGVSNLGGTLYIDNVNKALALTGTNYGDAGSVLTSNGAGNATTWNRPYFMKARVITDYNISSYANPILMTEDNLGGNNYNFGDFSVDTWTCPQTGIYRVSTSLTASSQTGDELRQLVNNTKLQTNAGVDIRQISESVIFTGFEDASEFWEASVPDKSIEHINIGEKVKLYPYYVIGSGSGITIEGRAEAARTYMIIERIV